MVNKNEIYYELVDKMKKLQDKSKYTTDVAHGLADDYLIDFIRKIGYVELAEAWELVDKWYD